MRYSFITFRSHPTEKHLDEEFLTMIQPMLKSTPKYIMSYEEENTIDSHFHLLMFHNAQSFDISNLKQKFKTKAFKNWFSQFENYNTIIDPKFESQALQIKLVGNTNEDYLTTVGYISKDNVYRSKEFGEQEITDAVKFYHINSRKTPKMDKSWKIMTTKTAHAITEDFCKKENVQCNDSFLFALMAKEKISTINLSAHQRDRLISELILAHGISTIEDLEKDPIVQLSNKVKKIHINEFELKYHQNMVCDNELVSGFDKKDFFKLQDQYNKFHEWVHEQGIEIPEKFDKVSTS